MQAVIRFAVSPADLDKLYRFRYEIYVEEMQRIQLSANHEARRIEDWLDQDCTNIVALSDNTIVGAVRVNFGRNTDLRYYEDLYEMRSAGEDHPLRTAICTRLMIAPRYRGSTLAVRLAAACYRLGLQEDIRWTFIDCNQHLTDFFEGLGYRRYRDMAQHPEYGTVLPLRFDCNDHSHLKAIKSPLWQMTQNASVLAGAPAQAG